MPACLAPWAAAPADAAPEAAAPALCAPDAALPPWLLPEGPEPPPEGVAVISTTTLPASSLTCASPRPISSARACLVASSACWASGATSVLSSTFSRRSSVVSCLSTCRGVGWATEGVKCCAIRLWALGGSTVGMMRWIPKEFFSEPLICLNLGTFISANDSSSTKKAMSSVARSAKVASQAGAPGLHGGHSSHLGQSSGPKALADLLGASSAGAAGVVSGTA